MVFSAVNRRKMLRRVLRVYTPGLNTSRRHGLGFERPIARGGITIELARSPSGSVLFRQELILIGWPPAPRHRTRP